MMAEVSSIQLTLAVIGIFLLALVWVYIAARLGALGVARSWFEFKSKLRKHRRNDDE